MVTVLALPINLVAGLFGMNVGGIPLSITPVRLLFRPESPVAIDRAFGVLGVCHAALLDNRAGV